jgi:hypothetical protein
LVGSEASPPGEGYPYQEWLRPLVARPSLSPRKLATQIVNKTVQYYESRFDVAQSAVDTTRLDTLAAATDQFAQALMPKYPAYRDALNRARLNAQHFADSYLYVHYKDLIDYAELVGQETQDEELAQRAAAVKQALETAVIAEAHTGSTVARSHGLSIYVPDASDYSTTRHRYQDLALSRSIRWDEWLDTYTEIGTRRLGP